MSYSCAHNSHLPSGLCECHHDRTPRKACCKVAACPEYGCESCAKKASTPVLQSPDPHWPIRSQIDFKIAALVYKCLHGEAPECLQNLLITHVPRSEGLRSEAIINRLLFPRTGKKLLQTELLVLQAPNYGIVCQMISSSKKTSNISRRALRPFYLN